MKKSIVLILASFITIMLSCTGGGGKNDLVRYDEPDSSYTRSKGVLLFTDSIKRTIQNDQLEDGSIKESITTDCYFKISKNLLPFIYGKCKIQDPCIEYTSYILNSDSVTYTGVRTAYLTVDLELDTINNIVKTRTVNTIHGSQFRINKQQLLYAFQKAELKFIVMYN